MIDPRQRAYLAAMDIPVWVPREQAQSVPTSTPASLQLGPGSSGVLLVCARQDEPAGTLAHDIARTLSEAPVWAWLAQEDDGQGVAEAVDECLFTSLVVFGAGVARQLFGQSIPERQGQARVMVVDDLATLSEQPAARRKLWGALCQWRLVKASQ